MLLTASTNARLVAQIQYAGVNFVDTYLRKGDPFPATTFPISLGMEGAGVVVALPEEQDVLDDAEYQTRGYKEGGAVLVVRIHLIQWYYLPLFASHSPRFRLCQQAQGCFAEYISTPWANVHPLPPSITPLASVVTGAQALSALAFMTEAHNVKKGETILVHTVAGGLGLNFAQIAKARGAIVIGTTSNEEKAALARAHGADHVIIYTKEDTVQRVLEVTKGEGVHAVFDGVGKDTFDANFEILRRKGTLVSAGFASGLVPPVAPLKLSPKNLALVAPSLQSYVTTPAESHRYVSELFNLIVAGTIKLNLHKIYPFTAEGVKQSQRDITGRGTTGKLVVDIAGEA